MSRYYGMNITIAGSKPEKIEAITQAAGDEWPFEGWDDNGQQISAYAEDNLYGGESEEQFTERITLAVWRANGAYCEVTVDATYLEALPYETHHLDEEDYARLINPSNTEESTP